MIHKWLTDACREWNLFWFTPQHTETLGVIRLLVGSLLFYTHAVWAFGCPEFFGENGLIPTTYREGLFGFGHSAWSLFDLLPGDWWLLPFHLLALGVFAAFALGLATRWTAIASWILVISYANRMTGSLFGLDQTLAMLTFYLAIGNSGGYCSLDSYRRRKGQGSVRTPADTLTRIATRLIQVHLCVIYLFAAIGKAQGEAWLDGNAMMMALASYEYQSLNLVWLVHHMWVINLATLVALFWELSYAALVWPRATRPVMIGLAIVVHLGIGLAMGMMTFGLAMIFANLAFVPPDMTRSTVGTIPLIGSRG